MTQDGSDNEIIELDATYKAKYSMDREMEDKICDFYDFYVQVFTHTCADNSLSYFVTLVHNNRPVLCFPCYIHQGTDEIKSSEIRKFYVQVICFFVYPVISYLSFVCQFLYLVTSSNRAIL